MGRIELGRRPQLMGGGLLRSHGGWKEVSSLRRGREAYRSDERILGSSSFVESILREAETDAGGRFKRADMAKVIERIIGDLGVSREALAGGGRTELVSRARAVVAYVWIRYLGQSGPALAQELGVSSQAVYAASGRVGRDIEIVPVDLKRWCR